MKKLFLIVCAVSLIAGYTSNELSRERALNMIKQDNQYPKVIDYDIYCCDPEFAKKVLDAGLEEQGLVTIQRTQKLRDIGKPIIQFSGKAQPYLLATPEKDKSINVQKVKLAEEELQEVTGIKMSNDGRSAVAEYTTTYKNVTPFSALVNTNFKEKETNTASFALYDDGWRLEKNTD
jgi:hypothetical protein